MGLQKEIAKRANVSISTVSRVFSGKSAISESVRLKVLKIAQEIETDRISSQTAQNYPLKKVAVLIPKTTKMDIRRRQFSWFINEGLKAFARQNQIELKKFDYIDEKSIDHVDNDIDGLILFSLDEAKVLLRVRAYDKPTVILNGEDSLMLLDSVSVCNRSAARLSTQVLIDKGHQKILHITCLKRKTVYKRLSGVKETMADNHLQFSDEDLIVVPSFIEGLATKALIQHIRKHGVNFTAIFAAADSFAIGAIKALQSMNIDVPNQIEVIGFDNVTEGKSFSPQITTVHIPKKELAIEAFQLLKKRYLNPIMPVQRVELGCSLIYRESMRLDSKER